MKKFKGILHIKTCQIKILYFKPLFCKNDFQWIELISQDHESLYASPKSMHKNNLVMQAYIAISQSMISSFSNIHDHAYAHITTCINISQEFKHINHGDISISKSCIIQNQSKWYSI